MSLSFKVFFFCHKLKMKTEKNVPIRNTGVQHLSNLK